MVVYVHIEPTLEQAALAVPGLGACIRLLGLTLHLRLH
jgi:hypothetical protein